MEAGLLRIKANIHAVNGSVDEGWKGLGETWSDSERSLGKLDTWVLGEVFTLYRLHVVEYQ
jgi:hypothetical protein